jgi:hypothetical protein
VFCCISLFEGDPALQTQELHNVAPLKACSSGGAIAVLTA